MSEITTIHDLFVEELQDIYHAEKQLTKALPKMAKKASNPELRDGFTEHLEETYRQCERLEQIFEELGMRAKAKPCEAMRGLIEEATEMMREDMPEEVMDVALVSCAQKVEHYEIASYGTLVALAEAMGHETIVSLLQETLEEEKHTDEKLTELAQSEINPAAMEAFQMSEEQDDRDERAPSQSRQQRERYAEMQQMAGREQASRSPRAEPPRSQPRPQPARPQSMRNQPSRTPARSGKTTAPSRRSRVQAAE